MPRKQPPEGYITAGEAARMLQVTDAMLTKYVRQGRLRRYGPEERKHKFYKLSEVRAIVDADRAFFEAGKETAAETTDAMLALATSEDEEGIHQLATRLFGRAAGPDQRRAWLAKEPRGHYVVKRRDGKIVSSLYLLPIKHERLLAYMRDEIRARDLTADDIEPYTPGEVRECIIGSIASDPDIDQDTGANYVAVLLRGVRADLERLGREGIVISSVYAWSETPEGIAMCLHLGMLQWAPPQNGRMTFYLDIASSEAFVLQGYKRGFAEWQREHPDVRSLVPITANLEEGLVFRKATVRDVDIENYLAYLNYWPGGTNPEIRAARRAFLTYNPDSTYHLYDRGNLVASINIVPLKEDAIEEFKQGKRGWLFGPDQIEQFKPGQPLRCIIIDFLSAPIPSATHRTTYAMQLLMNLALRLKEWGEKGIEITSIHACGSTDPGRSILRTAEFRELGEPVPGRVIFELDVQSSPLKLLQPYKEALARWKAKQRFPDSVDTPA